jgi:hypothetical protein
VTADEVAAMARDLQKRAEMLGALAQVQRQAGGPLNVMGTKGFPVAITRIDGLIASLKRELARS